MTKTYYDLSDELSDIAEDANRSAYSLTETVGYMRQLDLQEEAPRDLARKITIAKNAVDLLDKVAEILRVDIDYLVTEEEEEE